MRRFLRLPNSRGPLVLNAQKSAIRTEGADGLATAGAVSRVAVIAHWTPDSRISRSVSELTNSLVDHDYHVVIASSTEGEAPLEWPSERPTNVTVLRRPNVGYDFGSWATALDRFPTIAAADQVMLLNDSLAGPFQPIDHLLRDFDDSGADVWGLTDTSQFGHHLQSYCLGFKRGCLAEGPLAAFWRGIRVERSRDDVIWRYEIGLSRLLHRECFSIDAAISYRRVVRDGENPTIIGWRRLFDLGFPFVKRQLLRQPEVAPDGSMVRDAVRRKFGVEVDHWL
jgi:lipopolysaccharide biosynthesis protein